MINISSGWHPEFAGNCLQCSKKVEQPVRKQKGGTTKVFCSLECQKSHWYKNYRIKNRSRILENNRRYESKPENKIKKSQRAKRAKYWLRNQPENLLVSAAKQRAKEMNLPFSITAKDIHIPEICPLLGIPLFRSNGRPTPNSPSLDRIDSELGYTPENIWVISYKANTAKSNLTLSELKKLVENLEQTILERRINASRP